METHNAILEWLHDIGLSSGGSMWVLGLGFIMTIVILAFIVEKISKRLVIPAVRKITMKTQSPWDDYLLNRNVVRNLCRLVVPIIAKIIVSAVFIGTSAESLMTKACSIYLAVVVIQLICSFITGLYSLSSEHETLKNKSMKGFYQMLKLIVICVGGIIIISTLIDKDPITILTGLGAGTAILMLVFQDTIKGLVAGIQLMANDMLRPGDWISMPKYGADGDVLEVTLTTVKVQNWDKTITTVPPYALVNDSFQNWRGMFDVGGRRVKRSINIDMNTVRFCTPEELAKYKEQLWMQNFEATGKEEVNLYIFRHYVEQYLRNHPKVSNEMIIMVRQLQPTAQGLPVELYFFSADTRWVMYEHLQAEVFDHVIAMLNTFDLKVFQSPSGQDLQSLS